MFRQLVTLMVGLAFSVPAPAQPAKEDSKQQPAVAASEPTRVSLTVSANPAPTPRLQLTLLPTGRDRLPGNAALGYLRAIALQPTWPRDPEASNKLAEQLRQWETMPLEQLPVKEMGQYLKSHRQAFRAADEAARMTSIDWQQRGEGPEEIGATIEGLQGFRELARFLQLRYRWELADQRPLDALRTTQTLLQLGKHLGEGNNLLQYLVGLAIVRIGLDAVQSLIQHPEMPNLYWALATLPRPLVDPRPALDGEARLSFSFVPGLKKLEAGPVSEAEATQALQETFKLMGASVAEGNVIGAGQFLNSFGLAAAATRQVGAARKDLIAWGWTDKQVNEMPAAQIVLLRAIALHRRLWDEQVSLFYEPYPRVAAQQGNFQKRLQEYIQQNDKDPILKVYSLIFPAAVKCHESFVRTDRYHQQLMALEALRLQAAANQNQWPANLAEVVAVALPNDPLTGTPFAYQRRETTIVLSAPPPPGEKAHLANSREYTVTLRTK